MKDTKKQKVIIFLFVLLTLVGIVFVVWWLYDRFNAKDNILFEEEIPVLQVSNKDGEDVSYRLGVFTGEGGIYSQDEVIGTVGDINILGRTLNYYVWGAGTWSEGENLFEIGEYETAIKLGKEYLEEDFRYLNAAIVADVLTIGEIDQSSVESLISLRDGMGDIKVAVARTELSTISFERVTIWFYNMTEPEMSADAAQEIAKEKIYAIHEKLLSGELANLEAAGEVIRSDASLVEIDRAYEQNAYGKVENLVVSTLANQDPDFYNILEALPLDKYSEPVLIKDAEISDTPYPSRYQIYFVTNRDFMMLYTEDDLLKTLKDEYEITWNE